MHTKGNAKIADTECFKLIIAFQFVLQSSSNIADYRYDVKKERWCEFTIQVRISFSFSYIFCFLPWNIMKTMHLHIDICRNEQQILLILQ